MNRGSGWRFLDMGRRIERGVNTCRFARIVAGDNATIDDLDLLLDLADSQITYRARYLVGLALTPVLDMVILDPFNTRSLAFQVVAVKEHLARCPRCWRTACWKSPTGSCCPGGAGGNHWTPLTSTPTSLLAFERTLSRLSDAVADRYFLHGANAVPTAQALGAGVIYERPSPNHLQLRRTCGVHALRPSPDPRDFVRADSRALFYRGVARGFAQHRANRPVRRTNTAPGH
jgi:hypothetical protein